MRWDPVAYEGDGEGPGYGGVIIYRSPGHRWWGCLAGTDQPPKARTRQYSNPAHGHMYCNKGGRHRKGAVMSSC